MGPYHKARDTLTAAKNPKTMRMSLDGNLTKDVTVAGEMDLKIVKLEKVEESFDVEYATGQYFAGCQVCLGEMESTETENAENHRTNETSNLGYVIMYSS